MGSLKDIRARIGSTKNMQSITRAMKMVSAAKLRRAQINIMCLRPYALSLMAMIADIAVTRRVTHPLLNVREKPKSLLMVIVSSDRGLCGAFNTNVSRAAYEIYGDRKRKYDKVDFLFVGRRGAEYFRKRRLKGVETVLNLAREISYDFAAKLSSQLLKAFIEGEYDEVELVYNEFKSAIQQKVVSERLLPIDVEKHASLLQEASQFPKEMIFEPEPEKIIDELIERHFKVQVYRCLSESVAAEHGARMAAMENATKNAGEMIDSLTLTYNKLRQAAITTELIEITSGAEALKG